MTKVRKTIAVPLVICKQRERSNVQQFVFCLKRSRSRSTLLEEPSGKPSALRFKASSHLSRIAHTPLRRNVTLRGRMASKTSLPKTETTKRGKLHRRAVQRERRSSQNVYGHLQVECHIYGGDKRDNTTMRRGRKKDCKRERERGRGRKPRG